MKNDQNAVVILYVEDDKAIQTTMISILEDAGFDLLIADDGAEAFDILATEEGPIDGVMTDVNLGKGPTGWNVARRARLRRSEMPILYASAVGEDEWMVNGVPRSELVTKPFRPSHAVEAISKLIANTGNRIPGALRLADRRVRQRADRGRKLELDPSRPVPGSLSAGRDWGHPN